MGSRYISKAFIIRSLWEGSISRVQSEISDLSIVGWVESVLPNIDLKEGGGKVVSVNEMQFSGSASELDEGIGLSQMSRVAEVNIVPTSKILFIRNSLPIVRISISIQISVGVSGKCIDIVSLLITNKEG